MLETLGAFGGYSVTSIIIIVIVAFVAAKLLKKVIGNIICGGLLFWALNTIGLTHMTWTFTHGIIVALFGVPGTVFLALLDLIA